MEHGHRCLYCGGAWFCHDDCLIAGPSACAECQEKLRRAPATPRRVIALRAGSPLLDRLTEHAAERLRRRMRSDRP